MNEDIESGLDYAHARYYSSAQGRFTGADWTCPDFVDTKISLNDSLQAGGVHGREETKFHARIQD